MNTYVDAHCHLHDPRLGACAPLILECKRVGVAHSVVNGTCPSDWSAVAAVCSQQPGLIPAFGCHPWFLDNLSETWKAELEAALDSSPSAIGEIGLDSWRKPFDRDLQDRVFSEQLHIAAQRGIPASIHGLRAWDRVLVTLRQSPRPSCGVLLHSYGGPLDLVPHFVRLGAYFSCPGFFLRPGNEGKLALYKEIPLARLLIESDAPDQALPEALDTYRLPSVTDGKRINHPASVITTYRALAELRGINEEELQLAVYENFMRLFGDIVQRRLAKS